MFCVSSSDITSSRHAVFTLFFSSILFRRNVTFINELTAATTTIHAVCDAVRQRNAIIRPKVWKPWNEPWIFEAIYTRHNFPPTISRLYNDHVFRFESKKILCTQGRERSIAAQRYRIFSRIQNKVDFCNSRARVVSYIFILIVI